MLIFLSQSYSIPSDNEIDYCHQESPIFKEASNYSQDSKLLL